MPTYDPNYFSRTFAPPSPDFDPEDYFKPQAGEDFRDVQRNVGQRAASGLGYGTVNSMVANRLGQSINRMQSQNVLNQLLAGNTKPTSNYADAFSALGDKWATGTMDKTDPYEALKQLSANAKAAAASGDQSAVAYLDLLGSPEVQNALQYAANSKYGGPVARGFQNSMNDLQYNANRMGANQNIGDLYSSRFGLSGLPGSNVTWNGSSTTNPTTPTTDHQVGTTIPTNPQTDMGNVPIAGGGTGAVPIGGSHPTTPVFDPGTPQPQGSPVDQQINQAFSQAVGRPATARELTWWKNRYGGLGGDALALNQVMEQIANSQPAQRYRETGQAAPAVESAAQAVDFYNWLFGGSPTAPARNQWIQQYLSTLGMPVHSGTLRY